MTSVIALSFPTGQTNIEIRGVRERESERERPRGVTMQMQCNQSITQNNGNANKKFKNVFSLGKKREEEEK